jgi:hypothetical protein
MKSASTTADPRQSYDLLVGESAKVISDIRRKSITPDGVRYLIRTGKLSARRTAGGVQILSRPEVVAYAQSLVENAGTAA